MVTDEPERWRPERAAPPPVFDMPGWGRALRRGLAMRCPSCGRASAFSGAYTIREACPVCGARLGDVPCDTLPPYLSILIGLAVIGTALTIADRHDTLAYRTSLLAFIPAAIVLELAIFRPVKGFVLALMMKNQMTRDRPPGS
jgi:uncharacterized protein (DUF983 family)